MTTSRCCGPRIGREIRDRLASVLGADIDPDVIDSLEMLNIGAPARAGMDGLIDRERRRGCVLNTAMARQRAGAVIHGDVAASMIYVLSPAQLAEHKETSCGKPAGHGGGTPD